jgi:hypothetical protein
MAARIVWPYPRIAIRPSRLPSIRARGKKSSSRAAQGKIDVQTRIALILARLIDAQPARKGAMRQAQRQRIEHQSAMVQHQMRLHAAEGAGAGPEQMRDPQVKRAIGPPDMAKVDRRAGQQTGPQPRLLRRAASLARIGGQVVDIEAVGCQRAGDACAAMPFDDGGMTGQIGPADRARELLDHPVGAVAAQPCRQADGLGAGQARLDDRVEQLEVQRMAARLP